MFRTNMVIIMLATRKKRHIGTVVLGLRSHCLTNVTIYVTKVDRLGVKRVKIANNLRKLLIFYFFLYKYFEMLYFLYTRLVKNSKPVHICNFYHCYSQGHPPCVCVYIYIYRVSQEEYARLREGVPYAKVYRYNPKHLCPKLNGYGDNGQ